MSTRPFGLRRAFSMLEIMVVVLIVGVLAAVVVPRFGGVTDDAKSGATEGALGGVRSGIAAFRSKAMLSGTSPFPTLTELNTLGTVLQTAMPKNPYNGLSNVQAVTQAQAAARTVVNGTTVGWNYYVDNAASPPTAIFYCNSSTATTVSNGAGGFKTANQL
ncbi:MAG TPA: prepilin-type N-terminal cleavage/methylation domain-containing protein [Phycisphaerales bacterium]|nr:prepilin-type N-terminal cleavage/methylation domain-containing protein [Phycisphaerales bacterium]